MSYVEKEIRKSPICNSSTDSTWAGHFDAQLHYSTREVEAGRSGV